MNWYSLPIEIRCLILSMRHAMRKNALKTILKAMNKFQTPKNAAYEMISPFMDPERDDTISVMIPQMAQITEFCVKVLSGKENPQFWKAVLEKLTEKLWLDQYSGGPGAKYYNRTEVAVDKLCLKFNM